MSDFLNRRLRDRGRTRAGGVRTVAQAPERSGFADDLMPATVASVPVLLLILLLTMTDQTALLRSILQEGNPLALATFVLPLFAPTAAAALVYLARGRGWISYGPRATNAAALTLAAVCGLFVPLNYLVLQAGVFLICLTWIAVRRRRMRRARRVTLVAAVVTAVVLVLGTTVGWEWRGFDHLGRITVGRMLDGLTRMNLDDRPGGRSVLVISVNDAYALVASGDYPPRVESVPPAALAEGSLCQVRPRWNQLSVAALLSGTDGLTNGVPACVDVW